MKEHSSFYSEKDSQYFSHVREDIIALIPEGNNRVLEVACGKGNTLVKLGKVGKAQEIVGIDINYFENKLNNFIVGDIESMVIPYPDNYFDVIICADVLEHLKDPWSALRSLVNYLRPSGLFVASIPNVRDIKTLYNLVVKGDFQYVEEGTLDKSHLRFFCRKNIINLIEAGGLSLNRIEPLLTARRNLANTVTMGLLRDFLAVQYIVAATRTREEGLHNNSQL
jgi:2-polyprenyl-3-methyl-5-hydroxy-6-metoxy-1,4-benzoquinol methylase